MRVTCKHLIVAVIIVVIGVTPSKIKADANSFKEVGCFKNVPAKSVLDGQHFGYMRNMRPDWCESICTQPGRPAYNYFALTNGNDCTCGFGISYPELNPRLYPSACDSSCFLAATNNRCWAKVYRIVADQYIPGVKLCYYTPPWKGAQADATTPIQVQFRGTKGKSGWITVGRGPKKNTKRCTTIGIRRRLGELQSMEMSHRNNEDWWAAGYVSIIIEGEFFWFDYWENQDANGYFPVQPLIPTEPAEVCTKTKDTLYAGTDSDVWIRFKGVKDGFNVHSNWQQLDNPGDDMERNDNDCYRRRFTDVGQMQEVVIWHDGKNVGPDWHLDYVMIKFQQKLFKVPADKWIDDETINFHVTLKHNYTGIGTPYDAFNFTHGWI